MIQAQVLNKILSTQDSTYIYKHNLSKDFFSDYTKEYDFIVSHINTYGNVPNIDTFLKTFPEFELFTVSEPDTYLIDALYKDRNRRYLIKSYSKVRDLINADKIDEAMSAFINSANDSAKIQHVDSVDLLRDISRYDAYLDRCNDFNKFYIKTGFAELDEIIGGWDRTEELATIVARTNVGKSWALLKCAVAAVEQNLRVGIYSGEMSERKVGYRFDTLLSHISNTGITKGNRTYQNTYKVFLDSLATKYSGCLEVLTPKELGKQAGVGDLRAFIERKNLDILFIDQHSLLADDHGARNPVEKANNISGDLKNLQVLKEIPIIAVSQQNRSATDNGVGTEHIAQSDKIGQDSTIVIFFEKKDDKIIMRLIKSRDSENDKHITYSVDFDKGYFNYIPEDNNALEGKGSTELYNEFESDEF